jgi:hypothetical protein
LYNGLGQKKEFHEKLVQIRKLMQFNSEFSSFRDLIENLALKNTRNLNFNHNRQKILNSIFHLGIASSHQIFQKCQNSLIFCVGILYF